MSLFCTWVQTNKPRQLEDVSGPLTPWTAMMSGVRFPSSMLIQFTSAPWARASAISGRLRDRDAQYSCRPGVNCFGSENTGTSLPEHSAWNSLPSENRLCLYQSQYITLKMVKHSRQNVWHCVNDLNTIGFHVLIDLIGTSLCINMTKWNLTTMTEENIFDL